ncbi:putative PAP-specific phosphatase, mitochondrial isoform X1 [Lycium barbarum]|uniref:putative PAP-specific phosphatase, mitochondrial isoform X1 n=1 Tax=Lycium barbarum TaxID=112863 RepID=UPI00293E6EAC|nr:putative PAP-specific phosphatase, mitochondrial isoform X1 [Lycium barbarum]
MDLLQCSTILIPKIQLNRPFRTPLGPCFAAMRSSLSLPFPGQKAKYFKELEAAVDVVERACRLCIDVKSLLFSNDDRIIEKNDQTPVTIADFGVQALVSLEMNRLFPSIPLVAEEDSSFLRSTNLVGSVVDVVANKATFRDEVTEDNVLKAIDRGGKDACKFGPNPATYWVLDPIDGTRGFVRGVEALYVVALALVVDGQIALGVMGCPNWDEDYFVNCVTGVQETGNNFFRSGMIMVSHVGCGTWKQRLSDMLTIELPQSWTRCSVDGCQVLKEARFCTPESQKWESFPLSSSFNAKTNSEKIGKRDILLVPACCGSLCKYMMVASGRASVFLLRATTRKVMKHSDMNMTPLKKISGYAPAWDHAAGIICVHEAGGKVTDWEGSSIDFAVDQVARRTIFPSVGFLVTNHSLHNEILGLISSNSSIN